MSSANGNVQPSGTLELVKAKIFYKRKRQLKESIKFSDQISLCRKISLFTFFCCRKIFVNVLNFFQSISMYSFEF